MITYLVISLLIGCGVYAEAPPDLHGPSRIQYAATGAITWPVVLPVAAGVVIESKRHPQRTDYSYLKGQK